MSEAFQDLFRVTLLGTGAPPPVLDRFGPSTLVEVGAEKFIFDAARGHATIASTADPVRKHNRRVSYTPPLRSRRGIHGPLAYGWIGRPWGKREVPGIE
jgi:ribonuclease Z